MTDASSTLTSDAPKHPRRLRRARRLAALLAGSLAVAGAVAAAAPASAASLTAQYYFPPYSTVIGSTCQLVAYMPQSMTAYSGTTSLYSGFEFWHYENGRWVRYAWRSQTATQSNTISGSYQNIWWNGSSPWGSMQYVEFDAYAGSGTWKLIGKSYWMRGSSALAGPATYTQYLGC